MPSLSALLQPKQHQQQVQAAAVGRQAPQSKQKSVLLSTTSARSHSTPLGRTPQRAAPKNKPRFSIKDTPMQSTPTAFATPQAKRQKTSTGGGAAAAPAAAGTGSSARSLAGLLGGVAATPNPQASSADAARTPMQQRSAPGLSALFATPKNSSSKPPAPRSVPAQAGVQRTPEAPGAPGYASVGPAALFSEGEHASETVAAAAAAGGGPEVTPLPRVPPSNRSGSSSRRKGAVVNPEEIMTAWRQRQRAFLEALPAMPAAAGPDIGSLHLGSVCVPLSANLSKVWQQLQDVRKKQQDALDEAPNSHAGKLVWVASG